MRAIRNIGLALLVVSTLLGASVGASFAAPAAKHAKRVKHPKMDTLTVTITKTAKLWGHVAVSYKHKTCSSAQCTYRIPAKTKIVLMERVVNKKTWPFKHWLLNGAMKGSGAKLTFKMQGAERAGAVYVFK